MVELRYLGVIGSGDCGADTAQFAFQVGREVARRGAVLVCGGLGGVMEEACRGCLEAGGTSIGVLPGSSREAANPFVTYALPTGMGEIRNFLVVRFSDVLVALPGEYGTLSEMAVALKAGKKVVALRPTFQIAGVVEFDSPLQAVDEALR